MELFRFQCFLWNCIQILDDSARRFKFHFLLVETGLTYGRVE